MVYAVAASAALCLPTSQAEAAPRARVEGEMDAGLRTAIGVAVGETDRPIANRFEARRRARQARP